MDSLPSYRSLLSMGSFLGRTIGKSVEEVGVKPHVLVNSFLNINGNVTWVASAPLCGPVDDASGAQQRYMHNQPLKHGDGLDLIAVCIAIILDEIETHANPYTFHSTTDLPHTLENLHTAGV